MKSIIKINAIFLTYGLQNISNIFFGICFCINTKHHLKRCVIVKLVMALSSHFRSLTP